jgi:hypothetical protein
MCKCQLLIENHSLREYVGVTMHSLSQTHDNLGIYKNPFKIGCGAKCAVRNWVLNHVQASTIN